MIDGFEIGPLYIRFYGIILMLGAVAGAWLASFEARRRGQDPEIVWDLLVYLIIGGVIGARLWHIFTPPPSSIEQGITTTFYLTHPLDAVAVWKGGLGIPGAVIGGALALLFYTRRNSLSFLEWADIAAPCVALGQAIGRFGNFFNQELYGAPICRGSYTLILSIASPDSSSSNIFTRSSCMNLFSIFSTWCSCFGWRAGIRTG